MKLPRTKSHLPRKAIIVALTCELLLVAIYWVDVAGSPLPASALSIRPRQRRQHPRLVFIITTFLCGDHLLELRASKKARTKTFENVLCACRVRCSLRLVRRNGSDT